MTETTSKTSSYFGQTSKGKPETKIKCMIKARRGSGLKSQQNSLLREIEIGK